ncbi:DUF927 domain-containing protein [Thiomicrorhabdus xiamenensis]|uniref:DUF927 domain-containing protein n=1 Tax=Thiomicrorhabdus xiamenensis TaxID=2739063 RepID=A0A7D4NQV0_9GAMM|nr:DUF927 domain-containing protein [Thiomicrorhabdus xiamenensis]QKI89212.1 DUF927 domain-containing protein [Thiomicrorhabdus xiamenensis]
MSESLADKIVPIQQPTMPEGFSFGENGLNYLDPYNDNANPVWICSKLEVTASTRDRNGENWGRVLEFQDMEKRKKRWVMPMAMLAGRGDALHSTLLSMGLSISNSPKAKNLLAQYIQSCHGAGISICVERIGWFEKCYVLPTQTIGDTDGQQVLYQTDFPSQLGFQTAGTIEQWQKNVAKFAAGNSRIAFAISAAFTAPLLSKLGIEGGGFHFRGESSKGKTITLYAAGSVWGSHERKKTWRATSNGLEMTSYQHNDSLLLLDEMGEMNPREIGQTVYMLANGQAKQRHNDAHPKQWRLLFISTGEIDLKSALAETGNTSRAGHEVRLVDIEAVTGEYGVFDCLIDGYTDSRLQAETLQEQTNKYYGAVGIRFLEKFTENEAESLKAFRTAYAKFIELYTPKEANSQVKRVINRFAMVAAGGELATVYGLTGWQQMEAMNAAKACFDSWVSNLQSSTHSQEEMQAIAQVRGFIERYAESRFSNLNRVNDDHKPNIGDRAGYRGGENETGIEYTYYFLQEVFKKEVCKGISWKLALNTLKKHGYLKHQPDRNTHLTPETETGKRVPSYAVKSTILESE